MIIAVRLLSLSAASIALGRSSHRVVCVVHVFSVSLFLSGVVHCPSVHRVGGRGEETGGAAADPSD